MPGKVAPPQDDQPKASEVTPANDTNAAFLEALRTVALINGTFSSDNADFTVNTTQIAAVATWHFLQAWLTNFPQYAGSSSVNLFAESYGGKYGPTFFEYFDKQNKRRETGELPKNETVEIKLEALGILNGCIDVLTMTPAYMEYSNNNPYGIEGIPEENRTMGLDMFERPGGCKEQTLQCRQLARELDSDNTGDNERVNEICARANELCDSIKGLFSLSGRFVLRRRSCTVLFTHKIPIGVITISLTTRQILSQENIIMYDCCLISGLKAESDGVAGISEQRYCTRGHWCSCELHAK